MTTRLLVSVRDRGEALDALAAGADFVDLKEPLRGSLGAVDADVMRDVVSAVGGRVPVSAALGELLDLSGAGSAGGLPPGISLAKFGLAGCGPRDDWPARLSEAVATLPAGTGGVAVVYADWRLAATPDPAQIVQHAMSAGCRAVLVDTWNKGAGGLLDLWTLAMCADVVERIHAVGLMAVVGGSLTADAIGRLLPLEPDYVAVRGAVCAGLRTGRLVAHRVRDLKNLMNSPRQLTARVLPTATYDSPHA
jgi:(5-formylfuran-3-yl)methyl phosphate synthase